MSLSIESRCIHLEDDDRAARYGAVSFPIYQTATFAHPALGQSTGYDYSRVQNPTRQQLEKTVAALENGTDAVAFATGMAAILAVMELFAPGDHVVTESDLYGGTPRLFRTVCEPRGITFTSVNFSKGMEAARPMPVLPLVCSTIVPPGARWPEASAACIIERAARSLTLPVGLKNSSLASRCAPHCCCRSKRSSSISGVWPTNSSMECTITAMACFLPYT